MYLFWEMILIFMLISTDEPIFSENFLGFSHFLYRFPIKFSQFADWPATHAMQEVINKSTRGRKEFKDCKLCKMDPLETNSNSSPRDIVVSVGFGSLKNIGEFVRSLRTSGCQAQIVVFTDCKPPNDYFRFCDVIYVPIRLAKDIGVQKLTTFRGIRYKLLSHFLNLFPKGFIDRVLYADLYDTIFQGDPFIKRVTNNTFVLSNEGAKMEDSPFNSRFHDNKILGYPWDSIKNNNIYCSGAFMGSFENMKFVFNTISNWFPFNIEDLMVNDQFYYDMLVVSPFFQSLPWDFIDSVSGDFLTSCGLLASQFESKYPTKRKGFNNFPIIFHQYNRMSEFQGLIGKLCIS